ncbi:hypothetical protein E6C60_1768 [Paenibacillus algicola]|uniref:Uncharacterized protein n=1 Tax=Paenibacillus algicola TaxID=2565926 RepID=A0A4P8XJN4_9BACL|nr:hypothetical protein [Paenibacillus algicola]QCT02483.1 hypothetical protein E6C60_1768 [Paenibacillus algicola]
MNKETNESRLGRYQELLTQGKLTEEAAAWILTLIQELDALEEQNYKLRKAALRASRQDVMSTRLKEALYE